MPPLKANPGPHKPLFCPSGSGWLKSSHSRRQIHRPERCYSATARPPLQWRPNRSSTIRLLSLVVSDIAEAELVGGSSLLHPQSNSSAAAATAQSQGYAPPDEELMRSPDFWISFSRENLARVRETASLNHSLLYETGECQYRERKESGRAGPTRRPAQQFACLRSARICGSR